MGFQFATKYCPNAATYRSFVTMSYFSSAAMLLTPVVGIAFTAGAAYLLNAGTPSIIGSAVASLIFTLPVAWWLKGLAKNSMAIVFEATYGERASWDV